MRSDFNPWYALERIREWIPASGAREVRMYDAGITVRDDENRIVFAAENGIAPVCEFWDGRDMISFEPSSCSGSEWPLAPGECKLPEESFDFFDCIFAHLNLRDLRQCAQVSRTWRDYVEGSSRVLDLVPLQYRNGSFYRGRGFVKGEEPIYSNMRMAALFAPWELYNERFDRKLGYEVYSERSDDASTTTNKFTHVPNDFDFMIDVFRAWIRRFAIDKKLRIPILHPITANPVRQRPVITHYYKPLRIPSVPTIATKYEILMRSTRERTVSIGINNLMINGRWASLIGFINTLSRAQIRKI